VSESSPPVAQGGRSLGLVACTSLVIGNMVGSSFLMAPAALARYGALSIVVWLISALGAICLGLVFSRLARIAPATGGPYAWSRMAYGDFAGFLIAFGYWISIWTSLPAIAAAFVGYFQGLVPSLAGPTSTIAIALAAIWGVTLVNVRGIREAAALQVVTTIAKFLPFLAISLFGLLRISGRHFVPFNPTGEPLLPAIAAAAPITMFAFMGLESATIPAGDVRDPARTIPRATVLGILLSSALYILGTVVVLGVVPPEQLAATNAPFADAAGLMWGGWAYDMVAVAAIVSTLGTLNGWTLLAGQIPMAAAWDRLMPSAFGRKSARGVPRFALIVSACLASALVIVAVSGSASLTRFYAVVVGLSTLMALIPYVFCTLVEPLLGARIKLKAAYVVPACIAFVFSLGTIYGVGAQGVMLGFLLLLCGLPLYVLLRRERTS